MIYLFSLIAFFNSTVNGYDGSLINNLLQNPWFIAKYNGSNSGIWAGIVSSMYQIGSIVALPFLGPVCDSYGRRAGMACGAAPISIGTIVQGTSDAASQFMGGRFFLGFGVSLMATGGPILQLREYEEYLNMDGADKRWYDYRVLVRKGNLYRLCCNLIVSVFSQLAGNAVLSHFLGLVLDSAGYTSYLAQANITLINNCVQFVCAIFGVLLVERTGRRPLLLFAFTSCTVAWLGMRIATSQFAASYAGKDASGENLYTNSAASKAALAMIFLFGAAFSIGITPLQGLYPVEVLSFEMRAKGMAMSNLAGVNICLPEGQDPSSSVSFPNALFLVLVALTHRSESCRLTQL
ncbi:hypothetical protein ED733_005940 [Metarhizium rileyi]|uniref:Major facilitator superfamily (MFS) profile domain-containing protein n=1 Tax=Metarhizium rileyi (strain RCEF 4871) TaxID=1649241 RepID=A0A5C6GHZ5_METRR|nr:hypothetical protein ED733_005940 [Metarhizium rileyi]